MPAEWEPHEATWLAWPHERTDWPGKFAPIPWVYGDIVRHLARVERVRILVQDRAEERAARRILQKSGADLAAVDFFIAPTNRGWTRDFGPIFVKKCSAAGAHEPCLRRGRHELALQRLGQVRRLAERQRRDAAHIAEAEAPRAGNRNIAAGLWCSKAAASTSTAWARC